MDKTSNAKHKQWLLYVGLIQGIGGLAYFKYFNFFINSFQDAFHVFGVNLNLHTLNIIIPLGISFFTFRTLSYVLDINNGKIQATKDWVVFFTYVSFFPSILSGPIDRSKNLIPQLEKKREFDYNLATDGLRQILWGLFKKVVIADNCATITNQIFDNYQRLPASSLLLGAFFYTIQLYADFSGYSDMAIGISKLLGFRIAKNFDFPFFAQNIAEFWRKWHISLTSWLTDYVFTPLSIAFRDYGKQGTILAILINFTIIGIWHGANWTYVLFGFLHGCYYIPLILKGAMNKKSKVAKDKMLPSFREFINMLGTFVLIMMTLILFRSNTIADAVSYILRLFSSSIFWIPQFELTQRIVVPFIIIFILLMLIIEWLAREHQIETYIQNKSKFTRWVYYIILTILIVNFGRFGSNQFIYFQF
jgi:D-alanyl-lipoteichoic acid acyltransferase DltB (MBOAT superfamily)